MPNPFNPYTRIDFELDRARPVRLAVYDLAGRLVRRLVDRTLEAGRHNTVWDGRDQRGLRVASGVYFYRLESGDLLRTRKMVLLK
jgi:flagellar hook assembly protein FlgD